MLEFVRALREQSRWAVQLPGLLLAFLIAELFFKFHSFALECAAFLLTWLAIDLLVSGLARLVARPGTRLEA
jgi:uncharacterized membrane protein HdeD (DUF308 family)